MTLCSGLSACAVTTDKKNLALVIVLILSAGLFLGTPGIALLTLLVLCVLKRKWNQAVFVGSILTLLTFTLRSGMGRLLGIAESIWMSATSNFLGVGITQWEWNQAWAQRFVLRHIPIDSWKEIAPYFGVSPSFPFHLLAECGLLGLFLWVLILILLLERTWSSQIAFTQKAYAAAFTFWFLSLGTTPLQSLVMVNWEKRAQCEEILKDPHRRESDLRALLYQCPEIRHIEWLGSIYENLNEVNLAYNAYLRWHETYPRDVMPSYALGRLAIQDGDLNQARKWLSAARFGRPGSDPAAKLLQEQARRLLSQNFKQGVKWKGLDPEK